MTPQLTAEPITTVITNPTLSQAQDLELGDAIVISNNRIDDKTTIIEIVEKAESAVDFILDSGQQYYKYRVGRHTTRAKKVEFEEIKP